MKNKYVFSAVLLVVLALAGFVFTRCYVGMEEEEKGEGIIVVTSFYPMYIAAMNVVGENEDVELMNLSEPQTGCLHDYQLTPRDMMLLDKADVFIVNGGGIENFLTEVVKEYPNLMILDASHDILLSQDQEDGEDAQVHEGEEESQGHVHGSNTHLWMSMVHYQEQVDNIAEGLASADEKNGDTYRSNALVYRKKIDALIQAAGPVREAADGTPVVIFHEAYEYVAEDYGMDSAALMDLDEERQVSAGEVAGILKIIEDNNVRIVLAEELYGKNMGNTIEAESSCKVYYLDTLVRGDYDKDSWLKGMEANIAILKEALCEK